jgi:hypothetical protein
LGGIAIFDPAEVLMRIVFEAKGMANKSGSRIILEKIV